MLILASAKHSSWEDAFIHKKKKQALGLNSIIDAIKKFIAIEIELVKLEAREHFVELLSSMIIFVLLLALGLLLLLFMSLAAAFYVNVMYGSGYLGFVFVTLFYVVLIAVILIFKDKLITSNIFHNIFGSTLKAKTKEENHEERTEEN